MKICGRDASIANDFNSEPRVNWPEDRYLNWSQSQEVTGHHTWSQSQEYESKCKGAFVCVQTPIESLRLHPLY
jgi:hypothetical protein